MKKAAVYMRVSTQNQEKEETIQNQEMEIMQRIEKDGALLLPDCIYKDEGWSGSIAERPDLDRMRTDAVDKKFDILYVYDRGRLARKYVLQELILDELRKLEIECISLHDINGDSSEERLMGGVMGLFHEYERLKITERMRLGKLRKVRENKQLLGYNPKYGYDYHPKKKENGNKVNGYFTINEAQSVIVRAIFEMSASGLSKYAIRQELATQRILPPKAIRNMWSTGTLDRLLRDTTYIGEHFYNKSESVETKNPLNPEKKYRRVAKGSRKKRPSEEWMMVKVPAIIDRALFDKVQDQLARNKRFSARNNSKHSYLLSGIIECPCSYARTGECVVKNNSRYYRCSDRVNNISGLRKCYEKGVNATVLDSLVWNNVHELLMQPELLVQQAERWQNTDSPLNTELSSLRSQLHELDKVEQRYAKMYGEGVMAEGIYKSSVLSVHENRSHLSRRISSIENELATQPALSLEELVDGVVKLVESMDFANKKQIIRKLVTKVVATQKEVTVWGRIPLLSTEQVGLNGQYRYRWTAQCRQVNTFQRPHQQRHPSGKLSVRND